MVFEERVEVYVHKGKTIWLLLMSIAFVAIGVWTLTKPGARLIFGIIPLNNMTLGISVIGMFGFSSFFLIRKMNRKLPLLVLDEKGIYDCTSYRSGMDIPWAAIYDVSMKKVSRQRLLVLSLYDPEVFINQLPSKYRRYVARMNYKSMGSPAIINAHGLTVSPKELLQLLEMRIDSQKSV